MSGSTGENPSVIKAARSELDEFKTRTGAREPERGDLDDPEIEWRNGKPNYTVANLNYVKGKSMNHSAGSLEQIVEDLVKTWEMEASHKCNPTQWTTLADHTTYTIQANGSAVVGPPEVFDRGNYNNLLIGNVDKELYDAENLSFEESHEIFRTTFKSGFPWEVISVFSGPPAVTFSWRHWGVFDGEYRGHKGQGEVVEMHGITTAHVNKDLKIERLEVFIKPQAFLEVLQGIKSVESVKDGKPIVGPGCPFHK